MKCNVKKQIKQKQSTQELFRFFLMMCWVLNHDFGFGITRLKRLYDGLGKVNHEIESYQSDDGDNTAGFDRLTQWGLDIGLMEKDGDNTCLK